MSKTGLVFHEDYLRHNTGAWHPERAERLVSIMDHLAKIGLKESLLSIAPYSAELKWIREIHNAAYIEFVEKACEKGDTHLDADTAICTESYRIALLAAGGALAAIDAVTERKVNNAFCALRPPGHHAEKDRAMGFCLFNNVAIAARYLQIHHGIEKVFIIDWDVHHGNGTQNAFYDDDTVFYFSVHQYPHYPGTGLSYEIGRGKGEGFNLNVPLPPGQGDQEYIDIFQNQLKPAVQNFKPDFILISAGFDAHRDDQLSGMLLTESGYAKLTEIVMNLAKESCGEKIVSLLEGGYNLEKLAQSVAAHLEVLQSGA